MQSTFIAEMDNALKLFESLRTASDVRAYLMEGFDELAAFHIRHEQNKEAVKVLERKASASMQAFLRSEVRWKR